MNLLSSATEEQRADFHYTHLLSRGKNLLTYSLFPPYLGGGAGEILRRTYFPPIYSHGVGLGV
jgi:hypothetical protein